MDLSIKENTHLFELWDEYTKLKDNNSNKNAEKKLEELFEEILDLDMQDCEEFIDFLCIEGCKEENANSFPQEFLCQIISPIIEEEVKRQSKRCN